MKALIYTIVLGGILFVAVMYLRTIPNQPKPAPPLEEAQLDPSDMESAEMDAPPTVVKSPPAPRVALDDSVVQERSNDALYETGYELLNLWHVPEAVKVFEALIDRDPDNLEARYRLIECYAHPTVASERKAREQLAETRTRSLAAGDTLWVDGLRALYVDPVPALAAERFEQLVARDGQDIEARVLLAQAYLHNDRYDDARKQLEELLEGDATLGRAQQMLVQTRMLLDDFEGAERLARDLASLYPEEPYPYVLLSTVLLVEGRLEEASDFCNSALHIDHRYPPAIVAKANIFAAQGRPDGASVSFEKLLMFDDPTLQAVAFEGGAYVDFLTGRFERAAERMDDAIRVAVSEGNQRRGLIYAFRLMDYLCELGRVDAAENVLKRWIHPRGNPADALARLRIAMASGNARLAREGLERAMQDPDLTAAMHALQIDPIQFQALALIGENRFGRALQVLREAGNQGVVGTRRAYLRGFAEFQQGDAEGAMQSFQKTRFRLHDITFPYHGDPVLRVQASFFLAEAALARGESDAARQYYNEFLGFWDGADWELQAVNRAREKLIALSPGG